MLDRWVETELLTTVQVTGELGTMKHTIDMKLPSKYKQMADYFRRRPASRALGISIHLKSTSCPFNKPLYPYLNSLVYLVQLLQLFCSDRGFKMRKALINYQNTVAGCRL